jgi:hypothetical protein
VLIFNLYLGIDEYCKYVVESVLLQAQIVWDFSLWCRTVP